MKRLLASMIFGFLCVAAQADPCTGKVTVEILAYDRAEREALGLALNQCGRPVRIELLVIARNYDGFVVAKTSTSVAVTQNAPLSVVAIDLPFVQSKLALSDYTVEIKKEVALGYTPAERIADFSVTDPLAYREESAP